jgi:chemotaxis protein MotA
MKRTLWNYLFMLLSLAVFMLGALDATGVYIVKQLHNGFDLVSVMLIVGGIMFQAFASFSSDVVITALSALRPSFTFSSSSKSLAKELDLGMELVRGLKTSRSSTLQEMATANRGAFQNFLVDLLEANYEAAEIRTLANHKINSMQQAANQPLEVINSLNASSPAFGMLGTLLGLIVMLQNFENTTGLASGMGLAMMTTLYGLLLGQFVWQPLSKKIIQQNKMLLRRNQVVLEAVLLAMENKPDLFALDQLSAMIKVK